MWYGVVMWGIQMVYRWYTDGIFSDAVEIGVVCEWNKSGGTG